MKKKLLLLLAISLLFSACVHKKKQDDSPTTRRQIINALPIPERPFIAMFPHSSQKLMTMLVDKPSATQELSIDIEYLSGNALKGGRTSISTDLSFPYAQAFLLGSCSSGGKCSFDRDITTGTIKTKMDINGELHVLKSNYAFISGKSSTSDQKLMFEPSKSTTGQQIIGQTHGFLGELDGEPASEPVVITTDTRGTIKGTLTITSPDATGLMYYDGNTYQELKFTKDGNKLIVEINHQPWNREVTIIRDDLKGKEEDITLYLFGPIVPIK